MAVPRRNSAPRTSERGLDRLVNFSDAVVAIAITLIVLPLVDLAGDLGTKNVGQFLADNAYSLLSAGLSFVVIGIFWREHHRLYEDVTGYTARLLWVNLLWLASIVFLPLPTVLLVNATSKDPWAAGLYLGTMIVAMVTSRLQLAIITRSSLKAENSTSARPNPVTEWAPVAIMLVVFVIAVTVPMIGIKALLLILLAYPINRLVHRVQRRRVRA